MSQSKLMRGIILSALGLALSAGFFIPFQMTHAAVLYEQSQTGTPYDIFADVGANTGFYSKLPQYSGSGVIFPGGGVAYTGTASWLRIKRLSGLSCDAPLSISLFGTDGNTQIGTIFNSTGVTVGDYCDFPITGNNRTDQTLGFISICLNGDCDGLSQSFVLDGSPSNDGYLMDGSQTISQKGGWAFQICDDGGCEGGFELASSTATSTATTTDTGTGTTTATSTATSTPPTGASSVLFLPGIQASSLYLKDSGGNEIVVWPPTEIGNGDVTDLEMDSSGQSVNDIYTRDIMQNIPFSGPVYAGFTTFMNQLASSSIINSWTPYAYDWRYRVDDIANNGTKYEEGIRDVVTEIEKLATTSFSERVTIIAHSNGGLLAKSIMQRLQSEGKAHLVDKLVLLASPQLGTPKAIGTILHGYDQMDEISGLVINPYIARQVINDMPGAYGLLPSEKFFENNTEPMVVFKSASVTAPYQSVYGNELRTYDDYIKFVRGADSIDRGLDNSSNIPATGKPLLVEQSRILHDSLDNWVAPSSTKVIEIVGTGLPTMKSIEYRGLIEEDCFIGLFCSQTEYLKPFAVLTKYGDATVLQRSAEAYVGDKQKYFVNLKRLEDVNLSGYEHYNIGEALPVQNLLNEIIVGSTTSQNQFISTSYTEFFDEYDVEVIDSPIRILSSDTDGNQTGVIIQNNQRVIKEDIPGSQYFEFGDTKYLIVPKGTNRTTKLYGEDYGGYTLTTATLGSNDTQTINTILSNASVTPTMVAEYSNKNNKFSTVVTDLNGDGVKDLETTLAGVVIPPPVVVTYPLLISYVQSLKLNNVLKQAIILVIKSAESYANKTPKKASYLRLEDELLQAAKDLTKVYVKKKYLTSEEGNKIIGMIDSLKAKQ